MIRNSNSVRTQTLWLFRHGLSRSNASSDRPVAIPRFFSFAQRSLGQNRSLALARQLDWYFRGKHTPYEVLDRDISLKSLGKRQAYLTGKYLSEMGIFPEVTIVSSYLRTRQTEAGILKGISEASGNPLKIVRLYTDLITERWSGKTAGYPKGYLRIFFPEVHREFERVGRIDHRPPEGESIRDVRENRIPPLAGLLDHLTFDTTFMVGHGITNSCINSLLTGVPIERVRIGSPNLGVYKFTRVEGQSLWTLDPHYDGSRPIHPDISDENNKALF